MERLIVSEDCLQGWFLVFKLGGKSCAMDIHSVKESIEYLPFAESLNGHGYFKGTVNYGEKACPIMDLRLLIKNGQTNNTGETSIIFAQIMDETVGLIVDRITEVIHIDEDKFAPPPARHAGGIVKRIGRIGNDKFFLLDMHKLLIAA